MTNLIQKNDLNKILSIKILEEWPLSTRSYNALKDN